MGSYLSNKAGKSRIYGLPSQAGEEYQVDKNICTVDALPKSQEGLFCKYNTFLSASPSFNGEKIPEGATNNQEEAVYPSGSRNLHLEDAKTMAKVSHQNYR
jgi:hypothetical protein